MGACVRTSMCVPVHACMFVCVCVCVCVLGLGAYLQSYEQKERSFVGGKTLCCVIVLFCFQIHTGAGSKSQGGKTGVYCHEIQGWHFYESHPSTARKSCVDTNILTQNVEWRRETIPSTMLSPPE